MKRFTKEHTRMKTVQVFSVNGICTRNKHTLRFSEEGLRVTITSRTCRGWEEVKISIPKEKARNLINKLKRIN